MEAGYRILLFEGEGQGATLRENLWFNYKWEDSVSAILDYYKIDKCSLIGISWGGYFALRAASKEKRIKNVVAFDIMYDGLDVQFHMFQPEVREIISKLYNLECEEKINQLITEAKNKSNVSKWAIEHGLYITNTKTPYEFYKNIEKHTLKGLTQDITQNVLLLAGEHDHYIPFSHFDILKKELVNANVESRVFTEAEGGDQHCQVGNYDIALDTILVWLNTLYK